MSAQRQYILLVDDDETITEALSLTLEREGRTVILCSDVDAAEIALDRFPITHLVSDVQFSGEFGFEGLHFLNRVRARAPHCRIVLMTGHVSQSLRDNALRHGASAVLSKPFETYELERALVDADAPSASIDAAHYETFRIPAIEEILRTEALTVAFQPIVRLEGDAHATRSHVFAYEALTRVRGNWMPGGPEMLFDYATRRGKLVELNLMMIASAVRDAAILPTSASIFINVDPLTFSHPRLISTLCNAAIEANVALNRIVLEVTERSGFASDLRLDLFAELRALGVRFALDDHGSAYSHLSNIQNIHPSFIKISHTFGTAFELDETKERIVRHTLSLAQDFGCEAILEGIETSGTAVAAAAAGVRFGQGFFFSRARAASHWSGANVALQAA